MSNLLLITTSDRLPIGLHNYLEDLVQSVMDKYDTVPTQDHKCRISDSKGSDFLK